MNELKINGIQEFMGIEIPVIEGGFGENKKVISAKTISEIHKTQLKHINELLNNNINRFKESIDYLDIINNEDFKVVIADLGLKGSNRTKNIYLLSERGYAKLVKIMDTDLAWEIHDKLIDDYFSMRETLKETQLALTKEQQIQLKMFQAKTKDEVIMLATELNQLNQNTIEKLDNKIDRYSRFLCDDLSTLKKSELAIKLDTKPQTLAAMFKKLGIYTPTSQVSVDFLKKFANTKMITEDAITYKNPKNGQEETKVDWVWTGEGAKEVVDYLIEIGKVAFCENKGFKLVI